MRHPTAAKRCGAMAEREDGDSSPSAPLETRQNARMSLGAMWTLGYTNCQPTQERGLSRRIPPGGALERRGTGRASTGGHRGSVRPGPRCRRGSQASAASARPPPPTGPKGRHRAAQGDQAVRPLPGDQRFEACPHNGRLLAQSGQPARLGEQRIVWIQGGSHVQLCMPSGCTSQHRGHPTPRRSRLRYWIASLTCLGCSSAAPSRSATVRAILSTR